MKVSELRLVLAKQSYRMTTYANKAKRAGDIDGYNKWFGIVGVSRGYIDFIDRIEKRPDIVRKNHDYVRERVYLIFHHSKKCTNLIVSESSKNGKKRPKRSS